ncbi:glycosyl transferase family 2 [Actinomycetospora succinea]|uniref:Glycosyl transferase family 2 n=1 Tax=Actinomycetospora succinea TaxID=663603 RepID=A0A4R6URM4_9PSEU|nr:glycosyl transferase family 2 [Actinomycetospora succinea]
MTPRSAEITPPSASVCIPLFQKRDYIARTIDSVLEQTFTDFELVVLDNASTDGSSEIVDGYDDPRVRVVRHTETVPMIANFNAAVAATRAPLVKVLNADDLVEPEALERQVEVMDAEPDVAVVSSRHHLVDDRDRIVARDRTLRTPDLIGRQDRATVVRRVVRHGGNPLGVPGNMLFRRSAFDQVGGFPTDDDSFVLDVALAVRLTTTGDFYGLPQTLSRFRLASGSESGSDRRHHLRAQRAFVRGLRRDHADVVRCQDTARGLARWPLTWLRHHVLMSAASDPDGRAHRLAARVLAPGGCRDDRHA